MKGARRRSRSRELRPTRSSKSPGSTTRRPSAVTRVQADAGSGHPGSNRIDFEVQAADDARVAVREKSVFYVPR